MLGFLDYYVEDCLYIPRFQVPIITASLSNLEPLRSVYITFIPIIPNSQVLSVYLIMIYVYPPLRVCGLRIRT
jgi:hypothetical protein